MLPCFRRRNAALRIRGTVCRFGETPSLPRRDGQRDWPHRRLLRHHEGMQGRQPVAGVESVFLKRESPTDQNLVIERFRPCVSSSRGPDSSP